MNALSVLDIATAKGAAPDEGGAISAGEFMRLQLPFFSGCERCHATLGPYNAYPSRSGFIRCGDCIDDAGFATVGDFDAFEGAS